MSDWGWALLLKPAIGLAMIAAYYFGIIVPLRWANRNLPDSKLKRFLFKERGKRDPSYWSVGDVGRRSGSGSGTELQ
jgi:hypothetical protein